MQDAIRQVWYDDFNTRIITVITEHMLRVPMLVDEATHNLTGQFPTTQPRSPRAIAPGPLAFSFLNAAFENSSRSWGFATRPTNFCPKR